MLAFLLGKKFVQKDGNRSGSNPLVQMAHKDFLLLLSHIRTKAEMKVRMRSGFIPGNTFPDCR